MGVASVFSASHVLTLPAEQLTAAAQLDSRAHDLPMAYLQQEVGLEMAYVHAIQA
jgi:hypothetical protein